MSTDHNPRPCCVNGCNKFLLQKQQKDLAAWGSCLRISILGLSWEEALHADWHQKQHSWSSSSIVRGPDDSRTLGKIRVDEKHFIDSAALRYEFSISRL